jgi:hypothetical protein
MLLAACGGDKSDPGGARDSDSAGAMGTSTSGVGGSSGGDTTTGAAGAPGNCIPTPPPNASISDFSVWNDGNWGGGMDLTGGTFQYTGDTSTIEFGVEDGALHITGTVNNYVRHGMSFAPSVDATQYAGISFTIGVTIGSTDHTDMQLKKTDTKEV